MICGLFPYPAIYAIVICLFMIYVYNCLDILTYIVQASSACGRSSLMIRGGERPFKIFCFAKVTLFFSFQVCKTFLPTMVLIKTAINYQKTIDKRNIKVYINYRSIRGGDLMEIIRFYKQKRILHKYVRWMYDLLEDGRFYELDRSKKIKDLPRNYNREMGEVRAFERIYECADILHGYINTKTGEHKVTGGRFCGDRICPVCTIKKSLKEYSKLTWQMNNFKEDYQYYFLTLTLPNRQDGFRIELDLMYSVLLDLCDFVGYEHNSNRFRFCEGVYGSFEITKSGYGWHPHLHLVLAYPKKYIVSSKTVTKVVKGKKRTFENGLQLQSGKKLLFLNQDIIMNKFIELIQKNTNVYNDRLEDLRFLNIGFQPCYNIDDGINEMTKYLIDFEALESSEDLYVYMRDTYNFKQRVRRGCFRWTAELNAQHKAFLNQMHEEEKFAFYTIDDVKACNYVWDGKTFLAFRDFPALQNVEYTNLKREVKVRQYFKYNPRGPDKEEFCFEHYKYKVIASEEIYYYVSFEQLCINFDLV